VSDEARFNSREKTRLCPSCRMSISVLATKCRFCGENVGRPKDETRQLSIQDLGGETIVHYAPSSNVMEALESFRAEEATTKAPEPKKRSSIFGRKSAEPAPGERTAASLPELDERSKALASLALPTHTPTIRRQPETSWMKKLAFLGAFIAALIILYFGSTQGWAIIQGLTAQEQAPTWVNGAPAVLAAKGDPVEALRLAAEALKHEKSAANQEIMSQAEAYFEEHVQGLLNAPRITIGKLSDASNLANQGWSVAPTRALQELRNEVERETMAYSMHVVDIDTQRKPPVAKLKVYDPEKTFAQTEVQVRPDDTLWDGRFVVQSITEDYVRLLDTERKTATQAPRAVLVTKGGIPR
jgi:ribosomal protein L40E